MNKVDYQDIKGVHVHVDNAYARSIHGAHVHSSSRLSYRQSRLYMYATPEPKVSPKPASLSTHT